MFCFLTFVGCEDSNKEQASNDNYLVALIYENNAWGAKRTGILVTEQGLVYHYDSTYQAGININTEPTTDLFKKDLTYEQFSNWFLTNTSYVETLSDSELKTIKENANIDLNMLDYHADNTCKDAGNAAIYAIEPNANNNNISMYLLQQVGNWSVQASAEKLESINNMLIEKAIEYDSAPEDIFRFCQL